MQTFSLVVIIVLLIGATSVVAWQSVGLVKTIIARRKAKKIAKAEEDNRKEQ